MAFFVFKFILLNRVILFLDEKLIKLLSLKREEIGKKKYDLKEENYDS